MACNGQEYLCSPEQMPQSGEFLRQHWYLYWGAGRLGCFGVMERTKFLDTWDRCDQVDGCSVVPCASSWVPCGSPILSFNLTVFSFMLLSHHGRAEWSPGFQHLTHGWATKLCHALPWISKTRGLIWDDLDLSALGYPLFVLATGENIKSKNAMDANRAAEAGPCLPHSSGRCPTIQSIRHSGAALR